METLIGHAFQMRRVSAWLALVIAATAVASDLCLASFRPYRETPRVVLAVIAVAAVTALCRGNRASLGFTFRMLPTAPDNFIAGYFLVWAFLKSGSIVTPIALHALGNACALAAQVIYWHLIT